VNPVEKFRAQAEKEQETCSGAEKAGRQVHCIYRERTPE